MGKYSKLPRINLQTKTIFYPTTIDPIRLSRINSSNFLNKGNLEVTSRHMGLKAETTRHLQIRSDALLMYAEELQRLLMLGTIQEDIVFREDFVEICLSYSDGEAVIKFYVTKLSDTLVRIDGLKVAIVAPDDSYHTSTGTYPRPHLVMGTHTLYSKYDDIQPKPYTKPRKKVEICGGFRI